MSRRVFGDRVSSRSSPTSRRPALVFATSIARGDLDALGALVRDVAPRRPRHAAPLTPDEFRRSLDAFPLEYQAILDRHVVIDGAPSVRRRARSRADDLRRACEVQAQAPPDSSAPGLDRSRRPRRRSSPSCIVALGRAAARAARPTSRGCTAHAGTTPTALARLADASWPGCRTSSCARCSRSTTRPTAARAGRAAAGLPRGVRAALGVRRRAGGHGDEPLRSPRAAVAVVWLCLAGCGRRAHRRCRRSPSRSTTSPTSSMPVERAELDRAHPRARSDATGDVVVVVDRQDDRAVRIDRGVRRQALRAAPASARRARTTAS